MFWCDLTDDLTQFWSSPEGLHWYTSFLWGRGLDSCRLASDSAHCLFITWPILAKFAGKVELTKTIVSLCFQKLSAGERGICAAIEGTTCWQGKTGLVFFCIILLISQLIRRETVSQSNFSSPVLMYAKCLSFTGLSHKAESYSCAVLLSSMGCKWGPCRSFFMRKFSALPLRVSFGSKWPQALFSSPQSAELQQYGLCLCLTLLFLEPLSGQTTRVPGSSPFLGAAMKIRSVSCVCKFSCGFRNSSSGATFNLLLLLLNLEGKRW